VLEKHGFCPILIDANLEKINPDEIIRRIPEKVKIIGISVNSFTYGFTQELCASIKKRFPASMIVMGGPLASSSPATVLNNFACDVAIQGEGEFSFLTLTKNVCSDGFPFHNVSGAHWIDHVTGSIEKNPVERIVNIDDLPFPAYHLIPALSKYKSRSRKRPIAPLLTSRGCSFGCSFCSKDVFQRKVSFHSPAYVLAEIEYLVRTFGVRQIDIIDDNFAFDKERMELILDGLIMKKYNLLVHLSVGIRAEGLDQNIFRKMRRAGVFKISFGIESADETVLRLCNKNLRLANIERAVTMAKKEKILVHGFFIIGLPGETESAFRKTMAFAKRVNFDIANFALAIPFPNTELYRQVERSGRFLIDTRLGLAIGYFSGSVFFEYPGLTKADVSSRYERAYKIFYSPWKIATQALKIRSFSELQWFIGSALTVVKNLVGKGAAQGGLTNHGKSV
jgi:radical SAM superfamily enzyme YgiQ (UPF0313 family)